MHWLIAEDEPDIRNLVAMMCQVWGHQPMTFESGQKAWDWLDKVEAGDFTGDLPDLALMDIRMPGYRGDEVAQRIRKTASLKDIPIVLMTAFVLSDEERKTMMEEAGVDMIINKPLPDFGDLKKLIDQVIASRQAS
ncbi:response regulator [Phototrophicus methaneseepsis]|uniref:Response regulator n=1 Tax=Phototrophicus methaneseepsis TaxID=2710758 RepID=A0A7S8E7F9_9CHLR|nr:response regulator [Phototrophicus methaneseepsis]QPC81772.1 response regulator [Phototrophicus methaneseepsis]